MSANLGRSEFREFPAPLDDTDVPLFRPAGLEYACSGCGGVIPGGMHVHADVVRRGKKLLVLGIWAQEGTDGRVTHACGTTAGLFDKANGPKDAEAKAGRARIRERALAMARVEGDD